MDLFVNAGTAETDLRITGDSIIVGNSQNIILDSYKNIETIKAIHLDEDEIKISITCKNSGTIPVHANNIELYNLKFIEGKKTDSKYVNIKAVMYLDGNVQLYENTNLKKIKNINSNFSIYPISTIRLEPGETALIHITLNYDISSNLKSNNDKTNKEQENKKDDDSISIELKLGIIYSRFNE